MAKLAVEQLQQTLPMETFTERGDMVSVLVVEGEQNQNNFLVACSHPDYHYYDGFISLLTENELLENKLGEKKPINYFLGKFCEKAKVNNCAALALFQYAYKHQFMPLAFAQFWWGASPDDKVRHHAYYYPASQGWCGEALRFMLKAIKISKAKILGLNSDNSNKLEIVYEDEYLLLLNKPAGLLSVPGKEVQDSVQTRLHKYCPGASGPLLLNRLDLATSGLILAAKQKDIHKALQKQFIEREVKKEYIALLPVKSFVEQGEGVIDLPLRVDIDDRPRQMVCYSHGKPAITRWQVMSTSKDVARIKFFPVTGRTHQLRVHAAHKSGLNAPIIGDSLYGKADERLMLHASQLSFIHPITGKRITVFCEPEF